MTQPERPTSTRKIRLYVPEPLAAPMQLELAEKPAHYLANVMRQAVGAPVQLFNGTDGEWLAEISEVRKKNVRLSVQRRLRPQLASPDVWLAFAPIKHKTEQVVEKAVELGVSRIICAYVKHSVVVRINHDKLEAHAIEAAEQCERLDVPPIHEYGSLQKMLDGWPATRTLYYGDESGHGAPLGEVPLAAPCAVLLGPEGGFSRDEHHILRNLPFARPFGLGPRILRADTAAVAALACVLSRVGDWQQKPHFEAAS
jgi:16S rRNA (uracil1498-N3)-methyltransferase